MMTRPVDSNGAAELFVSTLFVEAYEAVTRYMVCDLVEGPPGRGPLASMVARHHWYQQLGEADQAHVQSVIRASVRAALFECLVLLDGMSGGYPISGEPSDYALFLQSYQDEETLAHGTPNRSIRINPRFSTEEYLHDRFVGILEERGEHDK